MAVKIRLRRMGRKKQPHYRVVVADIDSPRDGRFVETLGYYKPLSHPARLVLDLERVEYWENKGAIASATVATLVKKARKGGDEKVAIGEIDMDAEKVARQEALAARRREEAEAAVAAEKAAKAEAKAAAKAEEAAAKAEEAAAKAEEAGEAEDAPEADEAPAEEPAAEAPEAEAEEAPAEEPAAEAEEEPAAEAAVEAPAEEEKSE